MDWISLFFRLDGRIGRKAFWIGFGAILAAFLLLDFATRGAGVITALAMLALIYPLTAVLVKRLHDRGRSGWWALALVAIPASGIVAGFVASLAGSGWETIYAIIAAATWIAIVALGVLAILELGLRQGEPGYSEHGPPPLV